LFLLFVNLAIDDCQTSDDTLERLRHITEMFNADTDNNSKTNDDIDDNDKHAERFAPNEKIKRTFQK
jgi:hypothetical protein